MKVFIQTFGCSANRSDSEVMAGLLNKAGHKIVSSLENADLVIINSCGVKGRAEFSFFRALDNAISANKKIVVSGCIPSGNRNLIETKLKDVSVLGLNNIKDIVDVAEQTFAGKRVVKISGEKIEKICLPRLRQNKVIAIIPISEGCANACTYCFTKLAKGHIFSYPMEHIVAEAKAALKEGCRELWLTSQDNSAYGLDNKSDLAELLKKVCSLKGDFFVRSGMSNPQWIKVVLPELIQAYKNPKVFKFLHVPVQSGSNKVLNLMKRGYTIEHFKEIIVAFRSAFQRLTISTDIICGYPGETEQDWQKTLELINWLKPDIINMSQFWPRPGTVAAKLKQTPGEIKKARSKELAELYNKIALEKNKDWIGWEGKVLVDEIGSKGGFVARNFAYKPIVLRGKNLRLGQVVSAKVTSATRTHLIGVLI